jgi:hypothetical protein
VATLAKRGTGTPATSGTTWAAVTNAVDGAIGSNPATYATWTNAVSGGVGYIEVSGFDFSALITGTTLTSISVLVRHLESTVARITSLTFQPFDGVTAIGTASTGTLNTTAHDDSATFTPTLAQLKSASFKIRVTATHAANTQSLVESIDHVEITATYTLPNTNIALGTAVAVLSAGTVDRAAAVVLPATGATFTASTWGTVLSEFDFSDTTKYTQSAGRVSAVAPSSGSQGVSPVATGTEQPYTGRTLNGLPVLDFQGAQRLVVDVVDEALPVTLAILCATDILTPIGANSQVLGNSATQPTLYFNGGTWRYYDGTEIISATAIDTNYHVILGIFNGASSQLLLDGVQIATGNPGTTPLIDIHIGADTGTAWWDGPVAHVLYYDGVVANPAGLTAALNAKWFGAPPLLTLTPGTLGITITGGTPPQTAALGTAVAALAAGALDVTEGPATIALPTASTTLGAGTVGITAGGAPAFTSGSNLATGTVLGSGQIALPTASMVLAAGVLDTTKGTASPALTPAAVPLAAGTLALATAVSIPLPTAAAVLSTGTLATTGAVTRPLTSSSVLLTAGTLAATAGAATRALPTATATLAAGTLGISGVAPAQSIPLPTAVAVLATGTVAAAAGGVTRPVTTAVAVLTVGAVTLSVATPPITLALPTATAVLVAGTLTRVLGGAPQTMALPTATLVLVPIALNRTVGLASVPLSVATLVLNSGPVLFPFPGPVALAIIAATVTLTGGAVAVGSYLAVYFIQPGDALLLGLSREAELRGLARDATLIPDPRPRDATLVGLAHDAVLVGLARDADLMIRLGG